jgi:hypothetical protein
MAEKKSIFKNSLWTNRKFNYVVKVIMTEQGTVFCSLHSAPDYPLATFDSDFFLTKFDNIAAGTR